jgi:hypothetical protein
LVMGVGDRTKPRLRARVTTGKVTHSGRR